MRILIADDDRLTRLILRELLQSWGDQALEVADGTSAWEVLQRPDAPPLALLDWEMPGLSGLEVCRRVRQRPTSAPLYLLLLTGRDRVEDLVTGLQSGANDYLTKPFKEPELAARLAVARRTLELQQNLTQRVHELEQALAQVKQLRGMLPICAWCKKIRNDQNYWLQVEDYLRQHSELSFSHGICPICLQRELGRSLPGQTTGQKRGQEDDHERKQPKGEPGASAP